MPYADSHGYRIYYELEGSGPSLVFGHGGGDSLEMWRKAGYVEALKERFQLVLLDFPGHGRTEREAAGGGPETEASPNRESSRRRNPDAVLAVMDSLGIEKAHYWGYSMGAAVGFGLALNTPERFHSFILGGMTPFEWPESMKQAVTISIELYRMLLYEPQAYLMRMQRLLGRPLTDEDKGHFLSQDAEARIAGLTSLIDGPTLTLDDIGKIQSTCFLYCGDRDPFYGGAIEAARHLPRARFLSLPGLDHISALVRSDLVVPFVRKFVEDVS